MIERLYWRQSLLEAAITFVDMRADVVSKMFNKKYFLFSFVICLAIVNLLDLKDDYSNKLVYTVCLQMALYGGLVCLALAVLCLCTLMTFFVALFEKSSIAFVLSSMDKLKSTHLKSRWMHVPMKLYAQWCLQHSSKKETLAVFPQKWMDFDEHEKVFVMYFLTPVEKTWFDIFEVDQAWFHIREQNTNTNIQALEWI